MIKNIISEIERYIRNQNKIYLQCIYRKWLIIIDLFNFNKLIIKILMILEKW